MVWPITRVGVAEDERNRRIAYRLASVERLSPAYVRDFRLRRGSARRMSA
jgi:hypothetical protein